MRIIEEHEERTKKVKGGLDRRPVYCFELDILFPSVREAARYLREEGGFAKAAYNNILTVCEQYHGNEKYSKHKKAYGMHWCYKEDMTE